MTEEQRARRNILQERITEDVTRAVCDAKLAQRMQHSGLIGEIREIALSKLLRPTLPNYVDIGTGKLADARGNLSRQIDVVLYSATILPPSLYDEKKGIFPIESVLYTIEVKSTLTAKTLADAIENARSISGLGILPTDHWAGGQRTELPSAPPVTALFAFSSDIASDAKTELDRYREIDERADQWPAIGVICVVGKGYWHFSGKDGVLWKFMPPNSYHDEVLSFLGGTTNTIPQLMSVKGRPRFGQYLASQEHFLSV